MAHADRRRKKKILQDADIEEEKKSRPAVFTGEGRAWFSAKRGTESCISWEKARLERVRGKR